MGKPRALLAAVVAASAFQCQAQTAEPLPSGVLDALHFTIAEIRIEGATLVPGGRLRDVVRPFLGTSRRLADLTEARQKILEAYRDAGYELLSVDYDASRSRQGVHYFVVREVRLGKVTVTGTASISQAQVRREIPSLQEGATPPLARIARELFLFNDNPGRTAGLEYAAGAAGTTDVAIKVAERPQLRGALTYNNTGTSSTGTSRFGINVAHANLFDRSHQLSGSLTTSDKPSHVTQAGVGYLVPVPVWGDSVSLSAGYSKADSGRVADLFNVAGESTVWGAHYQRNLARDATARHVLDVGYDERRYRDLVDFFGVNLGTSVTVKALSAAYRYNGTGAGQAWSFGVVLQQNLPGGKRNDDATYAASRAGADARWRSWQFDAGWRRDLGGGWEAEARVAAQYADEPLVAAEQFGLGGLRAVRGFRERDGAGDRGLRANLELYLPRFAESQRLLAFVDAGASRRLNPQPGERAGEGVGSVGIGWRAQFANGFQGSLDFAYVTNGTPRQPRGDQMLHAAMAWQF